MPRYVVEISVEENYSKEEKKRMCDELLESLNSSLFNVKFKTLEEIFNIKPLEPIQEEKEEDSKSKDGFDKKFDYYDRVKKDNGFKTIWSVYEVEDFNKKHPFEGYKILTYNVNFGQKAMAEIKGKTWLDLYEAANECIVESEDLHHIFIEGFRVNKEGKLELITGS